MADEQKDNKPEPQKPTAAAAQAPAGKAADAAKPAEGKAAAGEKKVESAQAASADQAAVKKKSTQAEIVQVTLPDKAALYGAYMPFVKNGGLFIRTNKDYQMGEEIFILLKLMDQNEKYTIRGTVIWITPKGAQGSLAAGVGIQFSADTPKEVRNKIETYLAGSAQSDRRTDTM